MDMYVRHIHLCEVYAHVYEYMKCMHVYMCTYMCTSVLRLYAHMYVCVRHMHMCGCEVCLHVHVDVCKVYAYV